MALEFRSYAKGGSASTPFSVPQPSGLIVGDMMFLWVSSYGTTSHDVTSVPSGWTLVVDVDDGSRRSGNLYYKIATADDVSSWTCSIGASGIRNVAVVVVYTGISAPESYTSGYNNSSSAIVTMSGLTPSSTGLAYLTFDADGANALAAAVLANDNPTWSTDADDSGENGVDFFYVVSATRDASTATGAWSSGAVKMQYGVMVGIICPLASGGGEPDTFLDGVWG